MGFMLRPLLMLLSLLAWQGAHAQAPTQNGIPSENNGTFAPSTGATDRLIVKWAGTDSSSSGTVNKTTAATRAAKASALTGLSLRKQQVLTDDLEVLQAASPLSGAALAAAIQRLQADPAVEYASPDLRRHAQALTSDPLFSQQWYLLSDQPAATRTHLAWDVTRGGGNIVVAVLDTGARFEHPDLGRVADGGKLLPGYDFVSDTRTSNDGDGRDADASDPGDWVTLADKQTPGLGDCDEGSSSWHGTRVASLIGARTDNAEGVAGTAWNTLVQPVRVLGKCGGFDSDIIAGMRWAAGLAVNGAPPNPMPARIINLSLGGEGACTAAYQAAVDEIVAAGALLVVSVGNEGGPVISPANCAGVFGVTGLRHAGSKVGFSNVGPEVGLGAPGGNCVNTGGGQPCLFSIVVATNSGSTSPVAATYTDQFNYNVGTSFAAPMVSAAAALMKSVNARLTTAHLITLLQQSANAFPVNAGVPTCHVPAGPTDLQASECNCTTSTCGAGMLDTAAAVDAALRPFVVMNVSGAVTTSATLGLDASGSFASNNRTLTSFQWSVADLSGSAPVIGASSQAMTTLQLTGQSSFTLRLTVTDDQGGQQSKQTTISTPAAPPPTTPSTPSTPVAAPGGGGGGVMGWELLACALLVRRRRKTVTS